MLAENSYTKEEKILMLSGITPDIFRNPRLVELKRRYEAGEFESKGESDGRCRL